MPDDLPGIPLIASVRRSARDVGLDGPDKISKLIQEVVTLTSIVMTASERLGVLLRPHRRRDWLLAGMAALVVVAFFLGGLVGWARRDAAYARQDAMMWRNCAEHVRPGPDGSSVCWMWLKPPPGK